MNPDSDVVLITGASGGIGAATARRLACGGARVILCDLDQGPLDEIAKELTDHGYDSLPVAADTVDEPAMTRAVDAAVERYGRLDGLVTAAGIRQTAVGFLDLDLSTWERVQSVNVTGTFVACRAATRAMLEHGEGGSIVGIASVTSVAARMNQAAYCTSKAGVLHLIRTIALELAGSGIRVNAVCPGVTETPMIAQAVANDGPNVMESKLRGSLEAFRPGIPLGRLADPDEQAAAVEWLLSRDASYVTGAALMVDGGVSLV